MIDKKSEQDIESYQILKARFKATESNTFGLMIIFFSLSQKMIDNVLVAASHFSSIYETPPATSWADFEEKITQLKWKGDISTNTSHDLQLLLTNTIKQDIAEELIEAINHGQKNKIEHTITNILIKGLIDKSVIFEYHTERISHKDIINVKDERARREKEEREAKQREEIRQQESEKFQVEEGAVVLPVNLILAPVSGIPIYEVKAGDLIMVRLDGSTERGNYFIDLLNARTQEGEITPVKGTVKEVSMNALGEFELLIEIGPGIYGKTLESEQVKIKKYDFREDKIQVGAAAAQPEASTGAPGAPQQTQIINPTEASKSSKDYFIWLVGGITFILAILILYLLFSGLL